MPIFFLKVTHYVQTDDKECDEWFMSIYVMLTDGTNLFKRTNTEFFLHNLYMTSQKMRQIKGNANV